LAVARSWLGYRVVAMRRCLVKHVHQPPALDIAAPCFALTWRCADGDAGGWLRAATRVGIVLSNGADAANPTTRATRCSPSRPRTSARRAALARSLDSSSFRSRPPGTAFRRYAHSGRSSADAKTTPRPARAESRWRNLYNWPRPRSNIGRLWRSAIWISSPSGVGSISSWSLNGASAWLCRIAAASSSRGSSSCARSRASACASSRAPSLDSCPGCGPTPQAC